MFTGATRSDRLIESQSPDLSSASRTRTSSPQPLPCAPIINFLHLELFQNVASGAMSFFGSDTSKDQWVPTVLKVSLLYPTSLIYC